MNFEVVEWLENGVTSFHVVDQYGKLHEDCAKVSTANARATELNVEYQRVLEIL